MAAFKYDHDPETRRAKLTIYPGDLDIPCPVSAAWSTTGGVVDIHLSDEESIALYEILRANWAGYVAERDEARAEFNRRVVVVPGAGPVEFDEDAGYAPDDPKHPSWAERWADGADTARDRFRDEKWDWVEQQGARDDDGGEAA